MSISAKLVSQLREKTGAGMMDCKKALEETGGDFDKAIEFLRKKGAAVAAKRAEKAANEGIVLSKLSEDAKSGALVELNCETDFVARSEDFTKFANKLVAHILANDFSNQNDLLESKLDSITVKESLDELIGKVGEKVVISRFAKINVDNGVLIDYIHPGSRLAVVVKFLAQNPVTPEFNLIAKDIAMQIAAMRPIAISRDQINKEILDKEVEIYKEQARQEGKPEQIAQKIAEGRLNKFFKEVCLLEQEFVKDNSKVIGDLLNEYNSKFNNNVTIAEFFRYHLGDEKK